MFEIITKDGYVIMELQGDIACLFLKRLQLRTHLLKPKPSVTNMLEWVNQKEAFTFIHNSIRLTIWTGMIIRYYPLHTF